MTNEDYKELYDSATVGLWRTTINDGKFINANSAVADILGYDDIDDLMSQKTSDFYDRDIFIEELEKLKEVNNFEICMRKKDGSSVWVSISAKIYPKKGYIEGSIRDITLQKQQTKNIIPHLQKLSSLKQNIIARLNEEEPVFYQNTSVKTA